MRRYPFLPTALVEVGSPAALLGLLNSPNVTGVSTPGTGSLADAQSFPLINADKTVAAGYKGAGTYVAVIDTGVDYTRSAFGSCTGYNNPTTCKVFLAKDYGTNDGIPDDNGHGTNVGGIVVGVAPSTKLFALDIFDSEGHYSDVDLLSALNDVASWKQQGYNIRAVSMSLGWKNTYYTTSCANNPDNEINPFTNVFQTLRTAKVLPVVAAGNDLGSFNNPYLDSDGIAYPACTQGAVSVGAVYDSDVTQTDPTCAANQFWFAPTQADDVTSFSQGGPNLSLYAPGSCIVAAGLDYSGTSQATPHVSGAIAVLAAVSPTANAAQIQTALTTTGPWVTDEFGHSHHRLDVQAALAALPRSDATPPGVTAPSQIVTNGRSLGSRTVPVTVSWSASDASGVIAYSLWVTTDGGAWAHVTLPTSTANSVVFGLSPGSNYRFAVAAQDGAGNWSSYAYGPTFLVGAYQENSNAITYAGSWSRVAWASAYGGFEETSSTAGNTAKFSFTGRGVSWVAPTASNRGQAYVYVDGVLKATIDLYSASTVARRVDYSISFGSSAAHTIMVKVVGTNGRPTVDVDAFIALQ